MLLKRRKTVVTEGGALPEAVYRAIEVERAKSHHFAQGVDGRSLVELGRIAARSCVTISETLGSERRGIEVGAIRCPLRVYS